MHYKWLQKKEKMMKWLLSNHATLNLGLLFIRVGIGLVFVLHGFGKITGGTESWVWLGSQMSHLGITFLPAFWGFLAASAELIGGLCLVFGFATRIVSTALAFVMSVALLYHLDKGDAFGTYAHPLSLLIVFIGMVLAGPGSYSFDHWLYERKNEPDGSLL